MKAKQESPVRPNKSVRKEKHWREKKLLAITWLQLVLSLLRENKMEYKKIYHPSHCYEWPLHVLFIWEMNEYWNFHVYIVLPEESTLLDKQVKWQTCYIQMQRSRNARFHNWNAKWSCEEEAMGLLLLLSDTGLNRSDTTEMRI